MKMYLPPPGERRTRRSFLKRGLVGGALLALGGAAWLALKGTRERPAPPGLKVLSAREHAVMAAICARVIPPRSGWPTADALQLGLVCDGVLARTDDTAQAEVRQLLMLFENALAGFLFGWRTVPFTMLSPEEQDLVLREWATSAITLRRTGYYALRTLATGAYFGHRETWAAIGYGGPLPKIHDPTAAVWKGGGEPRPVGNGTYLEPPPEVSP